MSDDECCCGCTCFGFIKFIKFTTFVLLLIGLLCITCGYVINKNYNAGFTKSNCTYISYDIEPATCQYKPCLQAWVVLHTNRDQYPNMDVHWLPPNFYDRASIEFYYSRLYPIGSTVTCWYNTACTNCLSDVIFSLAPESAPLWIGVAFLILGLKVDACSYGYWLCSRRRSYHEIK